MNWVGPFSGYFGSGLNWVGPFWVWVISGHATIRVSSVMDRFTSGVRVQIGSSYFGCRFGYGSGSFGSGFGSRVSFARSTYEQIKYWYGEGE